MNPQLIRLYEVTVVSDGAYTYFGITTDEKTAQEEHEKLRELNTEDMIGLYSHIVSASPITEIYRLI